MTLDLEKMIENLEAHALELNRLRKFASRAFVIEFAGTPKSGKSTTVEAIRHFFSRHGFRVHILLERASVCPIPMKGHLFFNTWCATSMLAELLANIETETDIIIVDRGIFDALVWLTMQEQRGEVTPNEADAIQKFLLLDRWRGLVDLVVAMNVSPEDALLRENSQRISPKPGSIMNSKVLEAIVNSVNIAVDRYGSQFGGIVIQETTKKLIKESSAQLAEQVLNRLEVFLNPNVLVVPRDVLGALPLKDGGAFDQMAYRRALDCIQNHGTFIKRADAEERSDVVQVIPCGLLTYEGKIFLFQRKENDPKYRLYGNSSIWQGCHVIGSDCKDAGNLLKMSLLDRVSRSLYLSRRFPIDGLGYCWDKNEPQSYRHFGVVHRIHIDNPLAAADLRKKEFRKQRGYGYAGCFDDWELLRDHHDDLSLESWSRAILRGIDLSIK